MLKASFLILAAYIVQNICNYGFHFSMGRFLSVEQYGDLGALSSLLMIFSVPCVTILFVVTKFISTFRAAGDPGRMKYLYFHLLKLITIFSIFFFAVVCLISPFIRDYLHLASVAPVIVVALGVVATFYLQATMGVVQGLQFFGYFAIQNALFGVFKVGGAIFLVFIGFKLVGAIGGVTLSPVVLSLIFFYVLHRYFRDKEIKREPISLDMAKYSVPVFLANIVMLLIFSMDLLIIPKFFSDHDTGIYTSAITLGRAIYYVPGQLVYVIFPKVAGKYAKGERTGLIAFKGIGLGFLLALTGAFIFYYSPEFWIVNLFGEKYVGAVSVLKYAGFALIPMSLLQVYMNYELAKNRYSFIWVMVAALILQVGLIIFFFHHSFFAVLWVICIVPLTALFLLLSLRLGRIAGENLLKKKSQRAIPGGACEEEI